MMGLFRLGGEEDIDTKEQQVNAVRENTKNHREAEAPPQTRFHGVPPDKAEGTSVKQRAEVMQGPSSILIMTPHLTSHM